MLQKIVLAVAVFLVILVALTFGESAAHQLFDWIYRVSGFIINNFSDVYVLIAHYVRTHTTKVALAVILTIPVSIWILRHQGEHLKTSSTNRRIAIVLAIFLGWLGAHRFYLGQIGWGLFYLILFYTVPPIAVIAGLVDAIRYLFTSNEDFSGMPR